MSMPRPVTRARHASVGSPSVAYRLVLAGGVWPLRAVYRLGADGLEHVPHEGGFVLAANHESMLDPWPLAAALPGRRLHFMASAGLFNAAVGPVLRAVGAFSADRGTGDRSATSAAVSLVRSGEVVAMFPQGTRVRKGLRKPSRPRHRTGAARIALATGAPLVPAAIAGTDRLLRFRRVRVQYGPSVPLDDLAHLDSETQATVATRRLMDAIDELRRTI
jgi:1-acyl-sn-glycerol-3-phosphate acyltransferase